MDGTAAPLATTVILARWAVNWQGSPPMSPTSDAPAIPPRRWIIVGAVWVALSVAAVVGAIALDNPVGAGPRDEAQPRQPIIVGPIVEPGNELTGRDDGLPPLGLVLGTELSAELVNLPIAQRVEQLRRIAATSADPQSLLELGAAQQQLGATPAAREAYRDALRLDPDNVVARVGLAMADAATGTEGQATAAQALTALEKEAPRSQIVIFNRGWLDIYRREPDTALQALKRAAQIDPQTRLGLTAQQLVDAIENPPPAAQPTP